VRDGDMILLDAEQGLLQVDVSDAEWQARTPAVADLSANQHGMGRELFGLFRANATAAEQGGLSVPTFSGSMPFPVEFDSTANMAVAPVVAWDGRHQRVLR